jgi:RimJ/RimL family protein N-acetyltransferase
MPLPMVDGNVTIRPPRPDDVPVLVAGRDAEFHRFLGEGTPDPWPAAVIELDDTVVGWVDHDHDRDWLADDEVNIGYHVFAEHRRVGAATRAVRLLLRHLALDTPWRVATFLIDAANERSLALARRIGADRRADFDGNPYLSIDVRDPLALRPVPWGVDPVVRRAAPDDAPAMGRLHVRAWQHAYRGVMPDEYLDGLSIDERTSMWADVLARDPAPNILVATIASTPVGFAALGADGDGDSVGQLFAINLDPTVWRRGVGRMLLRAATEALRALGFAEAVLWVVPENHRARALYESEGWRNDGGTSTDDVLGVAVTDIRYRRDLRT